VPSEIDEVVRLFTKAVVREQVDNENLREWSLGWFQQKLAERGARLSDALLAHNTDARS